MKLSSIIIIGFCIWSLRLLIDDKYKVYYEIKISKNSGQDHVFCLNFNYIKIFSNRTKIDLGRISDDLLNYMESSEFIEIDYRTRNEFSYQTKIIENIKRNLKLFADSVKLKKYFIYKNQICINQNFSHNLDLFSYLFLNECKYGPNIDINKFHCEFVNEYFFDRKILDFHKIKKFSKKNRIIVTKTPKPYSECKSVNYSQFRCLNECSKRLNKLSKYYYESDENYTIRLDNGHNSNQIDNQSIVKNEEYCLSNECKEDDCVFSKYLPNNGGVIHHYVSIQLISYFDLIFQFISLIFLYLNLSVYLLLSSLLFILFAKFRKLNLILEIILIILCSILLSFMFIYLINDYKFKSKTYRLKETTTTDLKLNLFDIAVCFRLVNIHPIDNKKTLYDKFFRSISNKTLLDIELTTNNLRRRIKNIHLKFGHRKEKINWTISDKVLFQLNNAIDNPSSIIYLQVQRCFQIDINFNESRYRNLLALSQLKIKLDKKIHNDDYEIFKFDEHNSTYRLEPSVFIIPDNFNFDAFSIQLFESYIKPVRNEIIRRGFKCLSYDQFKYQYNCDSEFNCMEKCLVKNFFLKYSKIYPDSKIVIDRDQFTIDQWKNIKIIDYDKMSEGTEEIKEIEVECSKFARKSCFQPLFLYLTNVEEPNLNFKSEIYEKEFDIYHDLNTYIEEKKTSQTELLLEMINVQSVLFGLNILNLFNKITGIFIIKSSSNKSHKYLIGYYLICFIGSIIHLTIILRENIYSELIESQYYENQRSIEMSDLIFCIDHHVDLNRKLTYNDLDYLTNDLNANKLFSNISYLDNSNRWINLDRKSNFTNEKFRIETFYFLDQKCFQLKLEMIYNRTQFIFSDDKEVLRINFTQLFLNNRLIKNDNQNLSYRTLFFTKKKDKLHFSKFSYLDDKKGLEREFVNFLHFFKGLGSSSEKYSIPLIIKEEKFEIDYYDRFYLIKNFFENPLSIFYKENYLNDANQYLTQLIVDFKTIYNSTTLNLPIEKNNSNSHLLINDELFDNFTRDYQDLKDQIVAPNYNYHREFSNLYFEYNKDFRFELSFFKIIVKFENQYTWTKVIINLLNIITLWLGLNPISFFTFKTTLLGNIISNYFLKNREFQDNEYYDPINDFELEEEIRIYANNDHYNDT